MLSPRAAVAVTRILGISLFVCLFVFRHVTATVLLPPLCSFLVQETWLARLRGLKRQPTGVGLLSLKPSLFFSVKHISEKKKGYNMQTYLFLSAFEQLRPFLAGFDPRRLRGPVS